MTPLLLSGILRSLLPDFGMGLIVPLPNIFGCIPFPKHAENNLNKRSMDTSF